MENHKRYRCVEYDPNEGIVVLWDAEEKRFLRISIACVETWRVPKFRNTATKSVVVPRFDARQAVLPGAAQAAVPALSPNEAVMVGEIDPGRLQVAELDPRVFQGPPETEDEEDA